MPKVALKGTENGYKLMISEALDIEQVLPEIKMLLESIKIDNERLKNKHKNNFKINLDINTGKRNFTFTEKEQLEQLISKYKRFRVSEITSDVPPSKKNISPTLKESKITVSGEVVRNGQELHINGDLIFLGNVNEGGNLTATGNIYCIGNIKGKIQAGYPNDERKLIVGNLVNAQQVHIGEQFDIINPDDLKQTLASEKNNQLIAYVNELHVLRYTKLDNLKKINPRFYASIGGK